jgi:hypothetical protein
MRRFDTLTECEVVDLINHFLMDASGDLAAENKRLQKELAALSKHAALLAADNEQLRAAVGVDEPAKVFSDGDIEP